MAFDIITEQLLLCVHGMAVRTHPASRTVSYRIVTVQMYVLKKRIVFVLDKQKQRRRARG